MTEKLECFDERQPASTRGLTGFCVFGDLSDDLEILGKLIGTCDHAAVQPYSGLGEAIQEAFASSDAAAAKCRPERSLRSSMAKAFAKLAYRCLLFENRLDSSLAAMRPKVRSSVS